MDFKWRRNNLSRKSSPSRKYWIHSRRNSKSLTSAMASCSATHSSTAKTARFSSMGRLAQARHSLCKATLRTSSTGTAKTSPDLKSSHWMQAQINPGSQEWKTPWSPMILSWKIIHLKEAVHMHTRQHRNAWVRPTPSMLTQASTRAESQGSVSRTAQATTRWLSENLQSPVWPKTWWSRAVTRALSNASLIKYSRNSRKGKI